jgi:hypothetical protein
MAGIPLSVSFKVINTSRISSFTLVDARTGKDIREMRDNDVLNLKTLSARKLNIRANTHPQAVGSVVFDFNTRKNFQTENLLPYALFGNTFNNKYYGWTPVVGEYKVKATPYSALLGKGTAGSPMELSFRVVDEPVVERFMLVNADNGQEVMEIRNGDIIDLTALGIKNFNVRAKLNPVEINGRVAFSVNEKQNYAYEYHLPYELFGDKGSAGKGWAPLEGSYTVKATIAMLRGRYTYKDLEETFTVNFEIKNSPVASSAARTGLDAAAGTGPLRQISVYPNPVKDILTIEFGEAVEGELNISVYDILGRKEYFEDKVLVDKQHSVEIRLSDLPARNYILKVRTANLTKSVKFIKE